MGLHCLHHKISRQLNILLKHLYGASPDLQSFSVCTQCVCSFTVADFYYYGAESAYVLFLPYLEKQSIPGMCRMMLKLRTTWCEHHHGAVTVACEHQARALHECHRARGYRETTHTMEQHQHLTYITLNLGECCGTPCSRLLEMCEQPKSHPSKFIESEAMDFGQCN